MAVVEQSGEHTELKRAPLLRLHPSLGRKLGPAAWQKAERVLMVPVISIPRGPWNPPTIAPTDAELGLLVTDGQLIREVTVGGGRSLELLGDGDLLRPWQEDASSFCVSHWRSLTTSKLAVLDRRCVAALVEWPSLVTAIVERAVRRSRFLAVEAAASNQVGIERRILTLLWQLAEKWGRREPGAVVVTIKLTHEVIGDIVGARRPSVTLAIGNLVAQGAVERRGDRCWALLGDPPGTQEAAG